MIILGVTSSSDKNIPAAPTIGTAVDVGTARAYNNGAATVPFTPNYSGGLSNTYTVTSSPGSLTASGSSSPLTVTGLSSNTAYTFTATATNSVGTSPASSASNSITATTVPQAPTIGTASDAGTGTSATVAFTPGATGGKTVTTYTATSSPGGFTGTAASSPITVTGLSVGTAYTFTVTATNANGTSQASAASNSVTPVNPAVASFDSIASVNFTSGTAGPFSFTSIPQTYKHLLLVMYSQASNSTGSAAVEALVTLNGVGGSSYNNLGGMYFTGATAGANTSANGQSNFWIERGQSLISAGAAATSMMWIMDYTRATTKRSGFYWSGQSVNNTTNNLSMVSGSGLLNSAQAVTSITLTFAFNASSGTGMSLFGVKA